MKTSWKDSKPVGTIPKKTGGFFAPLLLLVILACLFWRSFLPDYVHFSNDGPLGMQNAAWLHLPGAIAGQWYDLNSIGVNAGAASPDFTTLIRGVLGPVGYAKFLAPIALLTLGIGAWVFFRALKLSPLAGTLGALATMLSSTFFAGACWSVASLEIAIGFDFLAMALVVANTDEPRRLVRWIRLALAGLCVGINVMEAADLGALCSIFVAIFVLVKSLVESKGTTVAKMANGIGQVAVVAFFAGFIATQIVVSLVSTQIEGIAGTAQDAATKAEHWDWATQWSLPKKETLGIFVPGLFGYRMDTPQDMMPALQDAYRGGVYWGGMGRTPEIDRFFDSGGQGTPPGGMMRFGYGGYYCGILVALVAFWGIAQSLRRQNSPFSDAQKKFIWFWTTVMVVSLLLAWGRFAPMFYGLLYQLPYFSTIRNPAKFLTFSLMAMAVLFAYGVHALSRLHLDGSTVAKGKIAGRKWDSFDRKWTFASVGVFSACVLGWLVFAGNKPAFVKYLQTVGFGDVDFARQIAAFSIGQVGWFIGLFAIAIILLTLVLRGFFSGPRATLGAVLLGSFLVFDLGRADLPFIIHWNYIQKYASNPVIDLLRDKPYEHRVAKLLPAPLSTPSQFQLFDQLYGIEWTQHLFPYYNIQSLDIIQMPRTPEDLQAYMNALRIGIKRDAEGQYMLDETTFPKLARFWELSNTRYLLGPAGFLNVFNTQFDPGQQRFRIVQRFDVAPKPGIARVTQLEQLTAVPYADGAYALFDFAGALPRAKLYGCWQVNTNDQAVLKTLADLNFDPAQTVLVDTPQHDLPVTATNENSGTVEITSYAPKNIVLAANATVPSVLLLNDKYDPHWRVTVDGKPAELLRCNYIMRGVYLMPGAHTVEFQFRLPNKPLYVTLTAIGTGLLLAGYLLISARKSRSTKKS
jgi:hypothetical protein